jgi:Putative prokaryotic signal transducing protein
MLDAKLVRVAAYSSQSEAEMAAGLLESASVGSMLRSDSAGGMEPPVAFVTGGYQVWVGEEDAETARALLDL